MRVIFMGTPGFSVPALRAVAAAHEVAAVYSQPPRAAGRGQRPRPSAVQREAEESGLEVRTPSTLREAGAQAAFSALRADVAVVVAYGLILPQAILDAPRLGCLNIHASLLPRWRGAAPIQRAVMAGDAETGVAIMQMQAGLDTGPVLAEARTPIGAQDTAGDLHDRLAGIGAALIVDVLDRLPLPATPQPADGVTYAAKIDKSEARIDWTLPASRVDRLIRGLSPAPGAWCEIAGERVRLLRSRVVAGEGAPGQVLGGFRVACGEGAVEITEAQRQGRRPMAAQDLLRGWDLPSRLD
ncbi:methionyl-tRNA formyltransferase [Paracoccus stylophorae]|uniref:Methionyl-tRNA formyltransferase n=1 Tax=Paracoccus stylophorae TaxID=659350 RepID=A0ABY7SWQ1_9RHOB|nr:methionyl-tRNA formyltransferase [Paracoccus stylophorae]WCR11450.1 methionyl-tRNA formyltransferase [Paracoccus stylophorae]